MDEPTLTLRSSLTAKMLDYQRILWVDRENSVLETELIVSVVSAQSHASLCLVELRVITLVLHRVARERDKSGSDETVLKLAA